MKQTQIQAFIERSSSPDPSWAASYPVTINSKARTNKRVVRYKLKCCCFKRHVLRQDIWTLIGSRLHSSQIATCRVYDELSLNDARQACVFFMSSLSEMIRKIIWIIFFSAIAPHTNLTLPYSAREDRDCNVSSFGLLLVVLLTLQ